MTIICPTSLYVFVSNICSVCFLCIKDKYFACVYFICVSDKYLLFFLFMSDKYVPCFLKKKYICPMFFHICQ